ncbi:MAG TPA: trypsin-like peptidase domain-containing protein [Saprospiraceae bacterium]|nr:trypsin-like peptidase domain-containing protein [Saprospiraceae bacterium]
MKKYTPFIITGLLSTCLAYGLFMIFGSHRVIIEPAVTRTVLTNYSPFEYHPTTGSAAAPDMVKASNLSKQAVVYIESLEKAGNFFASNYPAGSTGSGVIISPDGYIATNHHVIADGHEIKVLLDDGREFDAKLLGSDPSTDLALLKVDAQSLPYLTFGDSDSLMVGEWVLAIGNPFKLYSTVTAGIVSAKARNINILPDDGSIESFIQTDAAVNPGNSGGALVNTGGQLMGINTAIITFSGQYEGFSFAIPSNLAKKILEDIRQYGSPRRGWLGVSIRSVDNQIADAAGLKEVTGIVLDKVNEGSAAAHAGLDEGDIILSIDGQKITSMPDFMGKIGQHHPGDILTFTYVRDHKNKETKVKLSDSRTNNDMDLASTKAADEILDNIGLQVRELDEKEKVKFPLGGIMVDEIRKGSRIEKVNMEKHFIISRVNGISVASVTALKRELQRAGSNLYLQGYYESFPGDFAYSITLN